MALGKPERATSSAAPRLGCHGGWYGVYCLLLLLLRRLLLQLRRLLLLRRLRRLRVMMITT